MILAPDLSRKLDILWSRLQAAMAEQRVDSKLPPYSQIELDTECVAVFDDAVDKYLEFLGVSCPAEVKCSRTACKTVLDSSYYLIYNEPSTGVPRGYCIKCGRKIIQYNPELKYRKVVR